MADPVGTIGGAPPKESDLQLVLDGGSDFEARLRELGQAKDQATAALGALSLGREAKAALAEAKVLSERAAAEVEIMKREAAADAIRMRAEAQAIVDDATAKATQETQTAFAARAKVETEANKVRDDADAYAKKARADGAAALQDARQRLREVTDTQEEAKGELVRARAATEKANQAAAEAETRTTQFQAKIDCLLAAVRAVT
jgi:DNA repair exonuclease SbcCD ATPase subunit